MEELTDGILVAEIRGSLPILDSDEALKLLPPLTMKTRCQSVIRSTKLTQAVYRCEKTQRLPVLRRPNDSQRKGGDDTALVEADAKRGYFC